MEPTETESNSDWPLLASEVRVSSKRVGFSRQLGPPLPPLGLGAVRVIVPSGDTRRPYPNKNG